MNIRIGVVCALASLLAGCDTNEGARVSVVYEQIANFQSFRTSPDSSGSIAGEGIFILYRIDEIANDGLVAAPFTFETDEIVAVTSDATTNDGTGNDPLLLGSQDVDGLTVDAGEVLDENNGLGCFIKTAVTNDLTDLTHTDSLVDLLHTITPDQPVTMTRKAGNTDTALIFGDALPSAPNVGLQQNCGSEP